MESPIALPRELEGDPLCAAIRQRLDAHRMRLWAAGATSVPILPLGAALTGALGSAQRKRQLVLGLDEAAAVLAREGHGLVVLATREGITHAQRVSRLLLLADDGAERLYRRVERLMADHAPRLLTCRLAADARAVGAAVTGQRVPVKAILAAHKQAVASLLRALV